jgi:hypothetical protein
MLFYRWILVEARVKVFFYWHLQLAFAGITDSFILSERRLEVFIDLVYNPLGLEMRIVMHTGSNL